MRNCIIILLLLLMAVPGQAKKKSTQPTPKSEAEVVREQELKYYFYEAMHSLSQNRYDETFALLQHCEQVAPEDAATAHYLGILYGGLGQRETAMAYVDKAYRLCPEEYWYYYAVQHFQAGGNEMKVGIKAVEQQIKRKPDDSQAIETLQRMYRVSGNVQGAIKMQDKLDKVEGANPYGAMERHQLYMQMGKRKQAVQAIDDYLKYDPDNYYMQVFRGNLYLQAGDSTAAFNYYQSIAQHYPENPYLPMAFSNWYREHGDTLLATNYLMSVMENEEAGLEYKTGILQEQRWLKSTNGGEEKALSSLARQYPTEEMALYPLAAYYVEHERPDEALPLLQSVLDINPHNKEARMQLLSIQLADSALTDSTRLTMTKEALSYMSDADSKNRLILYIWTADLHMRLAENDSAYAYYDKALLLDPENVYVLNNYAYFLAINGGDLRKAEKMSQVTIKKEPHNATYLDTYAWIMHLQGQAILARIYMQRAVDNAPDKNDTELQSHYNEIFNQ